MTSDAEFLKQLRSAFQVEAKELLTAIGNGLVDIERGSVSTETDQVETIFRHAHSLKGAARAVNEYDVESLCQAVENVFAGWKRSQLDPAPELFDALQQALDVMERLLEGSSDPTTPTSVLVSRMNRLADGAQDSASRSAPSTCIEDTSTHTQPDQAAPDQPDDVDHPMTETPTAVAAPASEGAPPSVDTPHIRLAETVRINTGKLDALLRESEELLGIKLTDRQLAEELESLIAEATHWHEGLAEIRRLAISPASGPMTDRDTQLLQDALIQTQHLGDSVQARLESLYQSTIVNRRRHAAQVDELLEDVKKVLMMPFSSLLNRFPRVVRDLAHDLGKEVRFISNGGDIEVDRRILEELSDPLMHLVRNSIDHGIEHPDARIRCGKPACGTLALNVFQIDSSRIQLTISDDGAGIDAIRLGQKALQVGMIDQAQLAQMDRADIQSLLFRSGFSTSPIVTDISGRGLGLAIVAEHLEKLGGQISLESTLGQETTFLLTFPVTLTTFRALMVQVNGREFFVPTTYVDAAVRTPTHKLPTVQTQQTTLWRGHPIPLVPLAQVLGLPPAAQPSEQDGFLSTLILRSGESRIAFSVDRTLTDHEVLVKSLGPQLRSIRSIAGASILPSGQIVPILDVPNLVKSTEKWQSTPKVQPLAPVADQKIQQTILVAEDSITSRTLLRGILESAGYRVLTAVDGLDAFTTIKTETPDLVVSDIEMPRLNGLDLTARIRSDQRVADLPVVLVTALGSREDRERGIEVGANAYIVKSSFDQSNLLDVVRRLI